MKHVLLVLAILFGIEIVLANGAVVPGREPTAQAQTNPDPFNTKGAAPVVVNPPAVTIQAPPADNTLNWIIGVIGSVFALIHGKNSFFPAPASGNVTVDVAHPEVKTALETALQKLISSGALQGPVQSALGLVPGAGPILQQLEPLLHNVVLQELNKKLSEGTISPATPTQVPGVPDAVVNKFADIVQNRIEAAIARIKA